MLSFALIEPPYTALGFGVGLLVGLTGVGGGSLMTPLLMLLFGIHPATAVGTDLLFAAATKSVGTLLNGWNRSVEWRLTGLLAAGSLPATASTLFLLSNSTAQNETAIIQAVLFAALLMTAASLVARRQALAFAQARWGKISPRRTALLTVITGVLLGVLVSLSSIGAGAVGIIALLLLYPELPIARVIGSDIAHAVPLTLLAGIGHWVMGSVNLHLLVSLLAGSVPGILIGSYAVARVPDRILRLILASTLIVVAAKIVF
jgi:uncharacterized membrane protein YfcA